MRIKHLALGLVASALATFGAQPALGVVAPEQAAPVTAGKTTHSTARHAGLIVFASDVTGSNQLYTIRPDGSHLRQITHLKQGDASDPDFSADGRHIVFDLSLHTAASGDEPESIKIGVVNVAGSHLRWLPIRGRFVSQPSFTGDGRGVVFERFDGVGDDALFTARLDGSHERRLTRPPKGQGDTEPNVSPDGRTVSFVRLGPNPDETDAALFTLDLRTGRQRRLTPSSYDVAIKTSWSPNGRRILFSRDTYHPKPGVSGNVNTISRTGHRLREVTHFRGGKVTAFAGSYSPDGRHIVYRRESAGDYSLVISRPDGSHPRTILHSTTLRPRGSDWGPTPCSR